MPPAPASIALLLLAAGASSRMRGRDKLLETVFDKPMLTHIAKQALATGHKLFVTLPTNSADRRDALAGMDLNIIEVADAETGMASSLRAWAKTEESKIDGVMVILADMPDLTTADMDRLVNVFQQENNENVVRATDGKGHMGHPVLFPLRLASRFIDLTDDQGARELLEGEVVTFVALPEGHATTDLDTPEEWALWRAAQIK